MTETNITDNRKARNKIKNRTYSTVVKGRTNKDTNEKVIRFEKIQANLVKDDVSQSYVTYLPVLSCDTSVCNNSSNQTGFVKKSPGLFSTQDDKILRIFKDLQNKLLVNDNRVLSDESRIRGYFCYGTILFLSNRLLSKDKIKDLEKGPDFASKLMDLN